MPSTRSGLRAPSRFIDDYHGQTIRPALAMVLVVPLLVIYEIGAWVSGQPHARSGFEQLIFSALGGTRVPILLGSLACLVAIYIWHRRQKDHWHVVPGYVPGMILESLLLGGILFAVTQGILIAAGYGTPPQMNTLERPVGMRPELLAVVSRCFGTGVIEEVIFRLLLLSGLHWILMRITHRNSWSVLVAILLGGWIFAVCHYQPMNPAGEIWDTLGVACRLMLGCVFGSLFYFRGLGIAVVTHIIYNLCTLFLQQ